MAPMFKTKKVRLSGRKQAALHYAVWLRDGCCCAICGTPVPEGAKAHHEPPKSQGGEDVEDNLITLCEHCHAMRHDTAPRLYKGKCREYLQEVYGG